MSVTQTSLMAYESVKHELNNRQREVYELLKSTGRPLTASEIANKLNRPINTITPRIYELRGKDWHFQMIVPLLKAHYCGKCPITGQTATFWGLN